MFTLTLNDEKANGGVSITSTIEFESEEITVRDIIEKRVREEVSIYNNAKQGFFNGLVQPKNAEQVIEGFRMSKEEAIDPEKQCYVACDGFIKNAFFYARWRETAY